MNKKELRAFRGYLIKSFWYKLTRRPAAVLYFEMVLDERFTCDKCREIFNDMIPDEKARKAYLDLIDLREQIEKDGGTYDKKVIIEHALQKFKEAAEKK